MLKGAVVGFTNGFTAASLFFGAIAGVVGSSSFLEAYCGGVCREGGVSLGGGSQSWVICYQSVSICFSQKHTTINVTYSGFLPFCTCAGKPGEEEEEEQLLQGRKGSSMTLPHQWYLFNLIDYRPLNTGVCSLRSSPSNAGPEFLS